MMIKQKTISLTGLGYVGLPLAVAFGKHTRVIGLDENSDRVKDLQNGIDRIGLIDKKELQASNVLFTDNKAELAEANFHIITVPTPINNTRQPDLSSLLSATETLSENIKQGDIVVFESTVYPGVTEEICIPLLESHSGLEAGSDFHVGYSPERINPGDKKHTVENTIKVVSAQDSRILDEIVEVYGTVIKAGLHKAPSIRVAEAAKVIENTQRDLNIALMNELSIIFNKLDIDTHDVLEVARTKWNFLDFKPGLVGGHCIGVDPYYLTYKALSMNYSPKVILAGRGVNDSIGFYIARMLIKSMIKTGVTIRGANVIILGITFKENIPDSRNSRVIDVIKELESFEINTQVYDPVADAEEVKYEYGVSLTNREELARAHAVILAVAHDEFVEGGWTLMRELLEQESGCVYDVKSVLDRNRKPDGINLIRL